MNGGIPKTVQAKNSVVLYGNSGILRGLAAHRRGGRAVECNGLENRRGLTPTVGSNPTPSATLEQKCERRSPPIPRHLKTSAASAAHCASR